jgi:hypothetical protein
MPQSSKSGSRRTTRSTSSRSASAQRAAARTADFTEGALRAAKSAAKAKSTPAPKPRDPGEARRAAKKAATRRNNVVAWVIAAGVTVVIAGTSAGVYSDYLSMQRRIARKQDTLRDLQKQEENGRRRLAQLSSPRGREQVLVNNGYIKPGDRLLLFPRTAEEDRAARAPKNDLVQQPAPAQPGFWSRVKNAWRGFTAPPAPARS